MKPWRFILLCLLLIAFVIRQQSSAQGVAATASFADNNSANNNQRDVLLPLASIGVQLNWSDSDDYRLSINQDQNVKLRILSPAMNINDYLVERTNSNQKTINYFGDERYDKNPFQTRFLLSGPSSRLAEREYGLNQSHDYSTIFDGPLSAGQYPFSIISSGNGKNAFQLEVSQGVKIEASEFTLNLHGKPKQEFEVAKLSISPEEVGREMHIENYDGDGKNELELSMFMPDASAQILTVSNDREWATDNIRITPSRVGVWLLRMRVGTKTTQYSNAVRFRIRTTPGENPKPLNVVSSPSSDPRYAELIPPKLLVHAPAPEGVPTKPISKPVLQKQAQPDFKNISFSKKAEPTTAKTGQALRYIIEIKNNGPVSINNLQLSDVLPKGLKGNKLFANLNLKPKEARRFILPAKLIAKSGSVTNVAKLVWKKQSRLARAVVVVVQKPQQPVVPKPVSQNTTEILITPEPIPMPPTPEPTPVPETQPAPQPLPPTQTQNFDLSLNGNTDQNEIPLGEETTLRYEIKNLGPDSSTPTQWKISLPAGLEIGSLTSSSDQACQNNTCPVPSLSSGETMLVLASIKSVAVGGKNIAAEILLAAGEQNPNNNRINLGLQVTAPKARFELHRDDLTPNPAIAGEVVTVHLRVKNVGGDVGSFVLDDNPSELLTALESTHFEGQLMPGASQEFSYRARVLSGPENNSQLLAQLTSPSMNEPIEASADFARLQLALEKKSLRPKVFVGQEIIFEIKITNPVARNVVAELRGQTNGLDLETSEDMRLDLEPNEERSFKVIAHANETGEYSNRIQVFVGDQLAASATASGQVLPAPVVLRRSQVKLEFNVQHSPQAGELIIAERVPNGSYIAGTSSLNDKTINDPIVEGDWLFWIVPAQNTNNTNQSLKLLFELEHKDALGQMPEASLIHRFGAAAAKEVRLLSGDPAALEALNKSRNSKPLPAPRERVGAIIVNPNDGTHILQDQSSILIDVPLRATEIELRLNGEVVPEARIGQRIFDEGTGRMTFEYVAVPLKIGENKIELLASYNGEALHDNLSVTRAGTLTKLRLSPASAIVNDAKQPPLIRIELLDAFGRPTTDAFITLETNPEPSLPDANPNEPGYQVRSRDGVAVVPLVGLGQRDRVNVVAKVGEISANAEYRVTNETRPLILVGTVGAEAKFSHGFSLAGNFSAFLRAPLASNLEFTAALNLQAAIDKNGLSFDGNLMPDANVLERFPLLGDSGLRGFDAYSAGPLYLRLDQDQSYAAYGYFNAGVVGLLSNHNLAYNGLYGLYQGENWRAYAFAAMQPQTNLSNRTGVSPYGFAGAGFLYKLSGAPIKLGSERLVRVTRSATNQEIVLRRETLERLRDYTIDNDTGFITLKRSLEPIDVNGDAMFLEVDYTALGTDVPLEFRGGAQLQFALGRFQVSATALKFSAAAPLFAAGISYEADGLRAQSEVAYADALALALDANYNAGILEASAKYQEVAVGYAGPTTATTGRDLVLDAKLKPGAGWSVGARYNLNDRFDNLASSDARASLEKDFGVFSASAGLSGHWAATQTDIYGLLGLRAPIGPFKFGVEQRLPFTNSAWQTQFSMSWAISELFSLELADTLSYGAAGAGINNAFNAGVRGKIGNVNVSAGYEQASLANVDGRARVGIDTEIPITTALSVQLGAAVVAPIAGDPNANLGAGLRYRENKTDLSMRGNWNISNSGIKSTYEAGGIVNSEPLIVSPRFLFTTGPAGEGGQFSLAGAYRANGWNILSNHRLAFGVLATQTEISGELQANQTHDERFSLRFGAAYRITEIFTGQLNAGATYFFTDLVGLGASGSYLFQPATSTYRYGFGVEASLRLLPGLVLTGGFNLLGFDGLGSTNTQPGLFVRFDWQFDEHSFGLAR